MRKTFNPKKMHTWGKNQGFNFLCYNHVTKLIGRYCINNEIETVFFLLKYEFIMYYIF